MRHRFAIAIAAFLALLVGLPAALAQESTPEPGVSGERDFRVYCASCHGEDDKGGGPASFGLTVEPPDLTGLSQRNNSAFPRERILNLIDGREEVAAHGTREMPVWGEWFKMEAAEGLGGAEGPESSVRRRVNNLVDYLESIQQ